MPQVVEAERPQNRRTCGPRGSGAAGRSRPARLRPLRGRPGPSASSLIRGLSEAVEGLGGLLDHRDGAQATRLRGARSPPRVICSQTRMGVFGEPHHPKQHPLYRLAAVSTQTLHRRRMQPRVRRCRLSWRPGAPHDPARRGLALRPWRHGDLRGGRSAAPACRESASRLMVAFMFNAWPDCTIAMATTGYSSNSGSSAAGPVTQAGLSAHRSLVSASGSPRAAESLLRAPSRPLCACT